MSLSFSGSEAIDIPSAETLLNASSFSICVWFKHPGAPDSGAERLWGGEGSSFDIASWLEMRPGDLSNTGQVQFAYRAGNFNPMYTGQRVDDGNWYRLFVVRRSSTDYEMFLDNTSVDTITSDTGTNSGESPTITAGNDSAGNKPWPGSFARLAVWVGTAITQSEAETFLTTGVWPSQPNYWCEGEYASSPIDWSGNDVSLTSTGPPSVTSHPPDIAPVFDLPVDSPAGTDGTLVYKDAGTDVHVAGPNEHRLSTDDGANFGAANSIPGSSNDQAQYGGIAAVAGTDDTVHVLLPQADPGGTAVQHEHRVSTDGGANWSSPTTLLDENGTAADIRRVQIEVNGDNVFVVGLNAGDGKTWLFRSTDGGSTWDNGLVVPINRCQALAVDPSDGNVYVAGHDAQGSGTVQVARSTDNGASLGTPTTVSGTNDGGRPRATADNGTVVIGWQSQSGDSEDIEVVVSDDAGDSYGSVITAMDASAFQPQADKFNHFDLWQTGQVVHLVAASQNASTPCPVYHAYSTDGGSTWETPELAGTAASTVWMVRGDADWLHVTTNEDLYARRDLSDIATSTPITATLAGTSTDSVGEIVLNIVQSSTLAGTSSDSASPQTTDALSASLPGVSTDSATPSLQERIAATLAGTSQDTADPLAIAALVATLDGLSTDSASPSVTDAIAATLAGTSTDSGAITLGGVELLAATLAGTSLDSGAVSKAVSMSSTLSGTSTDTGDILATAALISTLAGTSTDSATPSVTDTLSGTLPGTSSDSALATLAEALSASLQGTSSDSGTISLGNVELMVATLAGVSSDSGAIDKAVDLSGTLAGTSSDTAAIRKLVDLLASLDGVSTDSGAIQTTDALTASLTGTSSDSASPSLTDLLNATLAGTSSDSAAVTLGDLTLLTATLAGTSTDSAAPSLTDALAAELAGTSTDTASARRTLALLSTLAGTSSDTGIISLSEVGAALDSDTTALVLKHADATTLVLMNSDSTLMQRLDEGDSEWPT